MRNLLNVTEINLHCRKKLTMLFQYLFTLILFTVWPTPYHADWGQTGHRVVGAIADTHLTKKAQRQIDFLLDGQSLAFVATYGDDIKSDSLHDRYKPWHYINFPFDATYDGQQTSPDGDLAQGIAYCLNQLKSKNSSKKEKAFSLKLLVHLVGDLHQPLHIGKSEDRGGNRFQVNWFGRKTNLHRVWDSQMIDSYQMSYSELVENRKNLTPQQIAQIQQGTVTEWINEVRLLTLAIYEQTKQDENLSYAYRYRFMDQLREQLHRGGLRLAVLLNDAFK